MHAFGQTGADVYVNGAYLVSATADKEARDGKVYEPVLFDFSKQPRLEREITLYLPLYKPVKVLGIGLDAEAKIVQAKPSRFPNQSFSTGLRLRKGVAPVARA